MGKGKKHCRSCAAEYLKFPRLPIVDAAHPPHDKEEFGRSLEVPPLPAYVSERGFQIMEKEGGKSIQMSDGCWKIENTMTGEVAFFQPSKLPTVDAAGEETPLPAFLSEKGYQMKETPAGTWIQESDGSWQIWKPSTGEVALVHITSDTCKQTRQPHAVIRTYGVDTAHLNTAQRRCGSHGPLEHCPKCSGVDTAHLNTAERRSLFLKARPAQERRCGSHQTPMSPVDR